MRASIACALVACAVVAVGCGSNTRAVGGGIPQGYCPGGNGILLIDWTVHGSRPSMTSCSGIANLTLFLNNPLCGEVQIDPISCELDKFRYDELPLGQAEVTLQGVDATGVIKVSGSAPLTLTTDLPAKATTVALQ
jgi:hypothetical protein